MRVMLSVAGALAVSACASVAPGDNPSTPTPPPRAAPTADQPAGDSSPPPTPRVTSAPSSDPPRIGRSVTLKATTDGPATLRYSTGGPEIQEDITGPWEKTVDVTDSPAALTVTVRATEGQPSVGCEITSAGIIIKNHSSGAPATATCRATLS